jgi:hypothetical protein
MKKKPHPKKPQGRKQPRKYQPAVRIPLDFDAAVTGLVQVKPDQPKDAGKGDQ